jgi:transposase-like protein
VGIVATLLAHRGEYGVVTALSHQHGVCRQTLYRWAAAAEAVLLARFAPAAPAGTPAEPLSADLPLARAILTLVTEAHASTRGIQTCLRELLGRAVGLATIGAVVRAAGTRAQERLAERTPTQPVALALDEVFGGGHQAGYLSAVDARSGVVWAVGGPTGPDAATWAALLRPLHARGLRWSVAVHDGGKAAAGGSAAAAPASRLQRDLWHVLHRCAQVQARLDRQVRAAEAAWERAERYEAAVAAGRRPRQRPPAHAAGAWAAAADAAADLAAGVAYLTGEVRRLLGVVVVEHGRRRDLASRRADLAAALALLDEVAATAPAAPRGEVAKLHRHLTEALPGLLVFAEGLAAVEQGLVAYLGDAAVDLIAWAWERRAVLGEGAALLAQLPPAWHPAARVLLAAWAGAVRASSAVEGWHAELRPHLAVRRTLSSAVLALLALRHNHRVAARGPQRGTSPLHRAGWPEAPAEWLSLVLTPAPAATAPWPETQEVLAA